jgi:hypothetical protein
MSAGQSYLIIGAQFLLNVLVLFGAMLVMAIADEMNRGRPLPPLSIALTWVSLLLALAPVIVAVLVFIARWRTGEKLPTLMLWSPLLATIVAIPLFALAVRATADVATRSREEAERHALEAVRSSVRAGSDERVCELVNLDPRATPDEVNRCFAKLEGLRGEALWRELQWFVRSQHFHAWNAQQLGQSEEWNNRWIPVVPAERQSGFLKLFFETWMAQPDFLQSREARRLCWFTLIDVFRGQEWSEEAKAAMRTTVVPELRRRLSGPSAPAVPEGSDDLSNEELLKNLDSMAHEDRGGRQEPLGE